MNTGTLILGLLNGSTIGLLAVGFVLVYKSNRFLNLAHAQLGAVSAILLAKVVSDWGWNWWISFVACVAIGVATGMVVERFLVAPVRRRTKAPVRLLMLSIGVSQLLLAITYLPHVAPSSDRPYPQPFVSHLQIGGVVLSGMSVLVMIAVPVLLVLLTVFLEFTSLGKQIRAAAGNPDAARLCGISVNRVSLVTWGVAGGLSALSAVFNGPTTTSFNASAFGPYLLMLTMGAAAFGAFVSIPAAVLGGVGLGVVYQVVLAGNEQRRYSGSRCVRSDSCRDLAPGACHRTSLRCLRGDRSRAAECAGARCAAPFPAAAIRPLVAGRRRVGRCRGLSPAAVLQ